MENNTHKKRIIIAVNMNSSKTYQAKIDVGFFLLIILILIATSIPMFLDDTIIWTGVLINLLTLAFISHTFFSTKYIIENDSLIIKCSFFYKKKIAIHSITKVEESRSILSSPTPSLDRLEIIYNKFDSILISPKDKQEFLDHLQAINPQITIKYRS